MNFYLYAQENVSQPTSGIVGFVPIIVIFLIFYFLLILPQQKKIKQHQKMLQQLKKGDYVLLSSGIYGTITSVKDDIVEVKIAENVKINVLKSTVSQIISTEKNL